MTDVNKYNKVNGNSVCISVAITLSFGLVVSYSLKKIPNGNILE